jgi:hypothetical protein
VIDDARVAALVREELGRSSLGVLVRALGSRVRAGAGSPEGAVAAPVGTVWLREDGGAGTTLYVKETGTGDTGWAAK